MRVDFRDPSPALDAAARTHAERCLLLALGRYGLIVPWVAVSVDTVERAGQPAAEHQVVVHVGGPRRFLVVEAHADVRIAIERAAARARRCLERDRSRHALRLVVARRGLPDAGPRQRAGAEAIALAADTPRKDND